MGNLNEYNERIEPMGDPATCLSKKSSTYSKLENLNGVIYKVRLGPLRAEHGPGRRVPPGLSRFPARIG